MSMFPEEIALTNLKGEVSEDERDFMTIEEAIEWLKELSGKDFGNDIEAWAAWAEERAKQRPSKFGPVSGE